jgi:hypothetical protein
MVVIMKSTIFWDVTPCIIVDIDPHFGRIYCLHLLGQNISQAVRISLLAGCFSQVTGMIYSLNLKMEALCSSEITVSFY